MENEKIEAGSTLPAIFTPDQLPGFVAKRNENIELAKKITAIASRITKVSNEEEDTVARGFVSKVNPILKKAEENRLSYTRLIDGWVANEMQPEKEIKAEIVRIRELLNQYANQVAADNRAKALAIEATKQRDQYIIEVKKDLNLKIGLQIATYIQEAESAISAMIDTMTLDNHSSISQKLEGWTPSLKEEKYNSLFSVDYDKNKLTEKDYQELVIDKARAHFTYEMINEKYKTEAALIKSKWRDSIPAKLRELEEIKKGNKTIAEQAEKRKAAENEKRKQQQAAARLALETKVNEEAQSELLSTEFQAQVQQQSIEDQKNIRKKIVYRLDKETEKDLLKVAQVIMKSIAHMIGDANFKGIYKRDQQGFPKKDEKGNPMYVDGIQFWLDELQRVPYQVQFPGLSATEEVTVIARKS
jgi:hypothetical protein